MNPIENTSTLDHLDDKYRGLNIAVHELLDEFFEGLDLCLTEIENHPMEILLDFEINCEMEIFNPLFNKVEGITGEHDGMDPDYRGTFSVDDHVYTVWHVKLDTGFTGWNLGYHVHSCISPDGTITYGARANSGPIIGSTDAYIYGINKNIFKVWGLDYVAIDLPGFDPKYQLDYYKKY